MLTSQLFCEVEDFEFKDKEHCGKLQNLKANELEKPLKEDAVETILQKIS